MSVTALSDYPEMLHKKKPFHRRNDSPELDVFEAARYFSDEIYGYNCTKNKMIRQDDDVDDDCHDQLAIEKKQAMKEKEKKKSNYKLQPSSPGAKLASFLNSLFNQTSSKKKKESKPSNQFVKGEEESRGLRRKRRSSISHFISSSAWDHSSAKSSFYSSSTSSGFRTPPIQFQGLSKPNVCDNNKRPSSNREDHAWLDDEKFVKISKNNLNGSSSGNTSRFNNNNNNNNQKYRIQSEEKEFKSFEEDGDSDSSSDLFELQNYDLGHYYSSDLPVYETTHMGCINRGAALVSNGSI